MEKMKVSKRTQCFLQLLEYPMKVIGGAILVVGVFMLFATFNDIIALIFIIGVFITVILYATWKEASDLCGGNKRNE